jgi:hypothetical protein
MIPRTYPSVLDQALTKMVVYVLPSVNGLTAWIDYIPVKGVPTESFALADTYANNGYKSVNMLTDLTGKQAWVDYIPVYEDALYNKPWSTDAGGYIPTSALAALMLDFTSGILDPRITFSRTTNATVTGSNGLIQNAPMNLLTFSEQLDNAVWAKTALAVSANAAVAPNGTTTADTFVSTASAGASSGAQQVITGTVAPYTFSVYAKAGTANFLRLVMTSNGSATNAKAWFNLATGTLGTVESGVTASITDVGNGWYRCSIARTLAAASETCFIRIADVNNSDSAVSGLSLFIWGAQLELGSTATTYNPTTVKNLLGFTENFDNAAWTKSNAFVQTNLFLQSEAFDTASWIKDAGVSVSANTTTAPDGTNTADTVTWASAANIYQGTIVGTGALTFSTYARVASGTANFLLQVFNATDGTLSSTTLTATTTWQRFSFNFTVAANSFWIIRSATAQSIFLWGAQLVQGTSAGDYKATYAAAAAVGYTDIYGQPFAQKLVATAVSGNHRAITGAAATVTGTRYTASVYAKQGEYTKVGIGEFNNFVGWATFDLSTGTVLFSGGTGSAVASITDVGNGWFRCAVSFLAGAFSRFDVYALNNAYSTGDPASYTYTGDGTSGIFIFGAQLSDSASVDPYVYQPVAAPTSTAYYGPRFDYDPVTLAPKGLLIEEQRTNLVTFSEQFNDAVWVKSTSAVTANASTSPDGAVTADKIIVNNGITLGSASGAGVRQVLTKAASAITYAYSVYAKAAEFNSVLLYVSSSSVSNSAICQFNLASGTAGVPTTAGAFTSATALITPVGNGWYRCTLIPTSDTDTVFTARAFPADTVATTGNGTSGVLLWGAQLEQGSFSTSYIPTVASQVTRAADNASMIGNNFARWYTQGVGTMLASFDFSGAGSAANPSTRTAFNISDGTSNNRLQIYNISGNVGSFIAAGGASQAALDNFSPVPVDVFRTVALAYASNDAIQAVNGSLSSNDTSVIVPVVNAAYIGSEPASARLNGHVRRISYYSRRLANSELQAITS